MARRDRQARKLTRKEAAYVIVAKYLRERTAAFGSERAISARLLGIDLRALVEGAARQRLMARGRDRARRENRRTPGRDLVCSSTFTP